ncbi:MAG: hypothetical protein ACI4RP_05730 [Acutalibacteraceae bacterium]
MDIILKIISQQWIFIVLSVLLIGFIYLVKIKRHELFYKTALIALVATVAALVLFALFGFQDLFLLAPIIYICYELFGYVITGKCVGVLLVDFVLIQLLNLLMQNGIINGVVSDIIFYALQLVAVVIVGILIDNHLRAIKKDKKQKLEEAKEQEKLRKKKLDRHIDEVVTEYGDSKDENVEEPENIDDLDISAILKKYSLDDDE